MKKSSKLKTALVAVGGGLAAMPASGLELGDVKVHSTIGQPLRASIAYALGPNEALSDTCVTLLPNRSADGMPALNSASMIVADGVIAITGSTIVREPMMTMQVSVRCPYTAQLTREYLMFIDPPGMVREQAAAPVPAPAPVVATPRREAPAADRPPVVTRQRPVDATPINATRYRVQPGDSLSEIAQRIENRPVGLWSAVTAIFEANPDAFIDSDPNKLKAGSWLNIPSFGADQPLSIAATETPTAAEPPTTAAATATTYDAAAFDGAPPADESAETSSAAGDAAARAGEPEAALADLAPGDVILDRDKALLEANGTTSTETIVIPDTELEGPAATSDSPNVPVATISPITPASEPTTTNWLLWLAGGGLAIIITMLLFGRRFREQFGSTPIAPAVPQRRKTDTQTTEVIADVHVEEYADTDMDMDIADDSPTEENLALDADLVMGTGLQQGTDVEVAQDFGFAATTDLDLELPEEMSSDGETVDTDIIPPVRVEESILESEVLPEDDDYDMSVIVDATKMPMPEDVTEKDLEAIQVGGDDETLIADDYTVSQEVDYKILEQDYEDELTATQRLNEEIARAAEDLASRLDENEDLGGATEEMPLATVHELDVTAQLHSKDDEEIDDADDTGVNPTVELEAEDRTVEMTDESTVEMPQSGKAGS